MDAKNKTSIIAVLHEGTFAEAAAVDNRYGAYRSGKFTMVTFEFSKRYGGARPFPATHLDDTSERRRRPPDDTPRLHAIVCNALA